MARKQLSKVNCTYGAPMGRSETHCADSEIPFKFNLQRVRLDSGGYDSGGAYWGYGQALYWYFSEYLDEFEGETEWLIVEKFIRAGSREDAKRIILQDYPNARFYR